MSTTRTLIAAVVVALVNPSVIPDAQPPVTTGGSPGSIAPVVEALSPGPTRETPDSAVHSTITVELGGSTVYAETDEQVGIVAWALERFSAAGLELPHVTVEMRSHGKCPSSNGGQNAGSLSIPSPGVYRIVSCGTQRTVLHELAHVWDNHTLDDGQRSVFLALRGLESWGHDTWDQAGGEHLAEVITWALDERHLPPSRIAGNSAAELAEAYRLITGGDAPVLTVIPRQLIRTTTGGGQVLPATDLAPGDSVG